MTPAIKFLKKEKIPYSLHEYTHDTLNTNYGKEASLALAIDAQRVFKTLIVMLSSNKLAVAIIPVSSKLNMKQVAKAFNVKKANMAESTDVERSTGYIIGGISPLGQKKSLHTLIDASAQNFPSIYISGGQRGLEIELNAQDLKNATNGSFFSLCS